MTTSRFKRLESRMRRGVKSRGPVEDFWRAVIYPAIVTLANSYSGDGRRRRKARA